MVLNEEAKCLFVIMEKNRPKQGYSGKKSPFLQY